MTPIKNELPKDMTLEHVAFMKEYLDANIVFELGTGWLIVGELD